MLHLLLMAGRTAAAFLTLPLFLSQDYAAPGAKVNSAPEELTAAANATPRIFRPAPARQSSCTLTVSGPTYVGVWSSATYTVSPYGGGCITWYTPAGPVTNYTGSVTVQFTSTGTYSITAVKHTGCVLNGAVQACGVLNNITVQ
jgi:hypothetical protein